MRGSGYNIWFNRDEFQYLYKKIGGNFIVTGDFNDVPNTYTYFTIRGKLQDAFLKQGFGIGRTYSGISPTLLEPRSYPKQRTRTSSR